MSRQVWYRPDLAAGLTALIVLTGIVVSPLDGEAAGLGITREYAACMRLARVSPSEGFESALAWGDAGGGAAAKHCAAAALFSLGQYSEAAERFDKLAQMLPDNPVVRAKLLAQSGQAWYQAGKIDLAFTMHSAALELVPRAPEIRVDRAMVLAESGQYWKAIDDLNIALEVDPNLLDALVLRASAYRYVDALDLAYQDVVWALELSPRYPGALLERGIIFRLQGRNEDARQDWVTLVRDHEGIPAADAAQRNLEKLDVKIKK
jgi:tetratricopeptide (TPR) repeat protein